VIDLVRIVTDSLGENEQLLSAAETFSIQSNVCLDYLTSTQRELEAAFNNRKQINRTQTTSGESSLVKSFHSQ